LQFSETRFYQDVLQKGLEQGLERGLQREVVGGAAGVTREWLYWYDEGGKRYPTPNERIEQESQRAVRSEQRVEELTRRLKELGVDTDSL
jgi:predicted transposase YdaD